MKWYMAHWSAAPLFYLVHCDSGRKANKISLHTLVKNSRDRTHLHTVCHKYPLGNEMLTVLCHIEEVFRASTARSKLCAFQGHSWVWEGERVLRRVLRRGAKKGVFEKRPWVLSGKKNSININFLARISCGHSWPLRPNAQGSKVSPHQGARRKTHFVVRTSTIFGADVHDPKGCWKLCTKKSLRLVFGPYNLKISESPECLLNIWHIPYVHSFSRMLKIQNL